MTAFCRLRDVKVLYSYAAMAFLLLVLISPIKSFAETVSCSAAATEGAGHGIVIRSIFKEPTVADAPTKQKAISQEAVRLRETDRLDAGALAQRDQMRELKNTSLLAIKKVLEREQQKEINHFEVTRIPIARFPGMNFQLRVVFDDGMGAFLGEIVIETSGARREIITPAIEVEHEYQKMGVSVALMAIALENNPQTEVISSNLQETNKSAYLYDGLLDGLSPLESVKMTPAYRMRQRLGYEIDLENSRLPLVEPWLDPEEIEIRMVTVRRDLSERLHH